MFASYILERIAAMKDGAAATSAVRLLKSRLKTILSWRGAVLSALVVLSTWGGVAPQSLEAAGLAVAVPAISVQADNPNPPSQPVKLVFVHHSTGGFWLADGHGGLGIA